MRFNDDSPALLTDGPPPGKGAGPNPSRLIAAGVAHALARATLLACALRRMTGGTV